jgi:predicted CoA-binding protein
MATLRQIEDFMAAQPIAMVGVSRNPKKFGYTAFKELHEKGLNVLPVNPAASEILGLKAFPDVKSLPPDVKGVIVMTKKDQTLSVVREAREKGIKNIWIQQMSDTKEALRELEGSDINFITGECVLMHYKANGIHKFHMFLRKLFGGFPK